MSCDQTGKVPHLYFFPDLSKLGQQVKFSQDVGDQGGGFALILISLPVSLFFSRASVILLHSCINFLIEISVLSSMCFDTTNAINFSMAAQRKTGEVARKKG